MLCPLRGVRCKAASWLSKMTSKNNGGNIQQMVGLIAWHGMRWDICMNGFVFYWDICMNGFDPFCFFLSSPSVYRCTYQLLLPVSMTAAQCNSSRESKKLCFAPSGTFQFRSCFAWYKKCCSTGVPQPVLVSLHLVCRKNTCQWGVKAVISSCFPPHRVYKY